MSNFSRLVPAFLSPTARAFTIQFTKKEQLQQDRSAKINKEKRSDANICEQTRSGSNDHVSTGGACRREKFFQFISGDTKELRLFVNFEIMGAALHDNLTKRQREPRKFVHNAQSGVFLVDHRCSLNYLVHT